jgi:predicted RNA-binding protein with PIN domain
VDGNNVMGSRPDGWWRDRPAAMRRLVAELEPLAKRADVTVVFDGVPRDLGATSASVAFAGRSRDAADAEIARRVAADADPGSLTVATSDRALAERVRGQGAAVIGARAFLARLAGGTEG